MDYVRGFIREEEGQDVVEYGLLIATIALVVLLGSAAFGTNIKAWFSTLSDKITTQTGS
jgi:pilus assembly protein Flp/PilA